MKYSYLSYLILLILSINLYAQKWDQFIGFSNINDGMLDLLECYDKGYLISGGSDMYDGNWIIKTDINGEIVWDKIINHNNYTLAAGYIDQNSKGEIAIGRLLNFPNGDQWPLVIKLDSCGNKLWCRYYIDDNYSHGWFSDVILFENGDILALGYLFTLENYNERIFLYYIDKNGTLVWRQSYASKENHPLVLERNGRGLHQFNNEFIITGECYYPYPGNPGTGEAILYWN